MNSKTYKTTTTTIATASAKTAKTPAISTKGMHEFVGFGDKKGDWDLFRDSQGKLLIQRTKGGVVRSLKPISEADAMEKWMRFCVPECWQECVRQAAARFSRPQPAALA
jgi:hypothetical protein